jgi:1-acyl-sn-glycerol-3-phosphate acyltransferase
MSAPGEAGLPVPAIDRALWARGLVPLVRTLLRVGYFRLEVVGLEHLPRSGRVVYAQNHAGWFALDAFFVGLAIAEALGEEATPFFAAHDQAVSAPVLGPFLRRVGALPVSWFRRPERLPPEIRSVGIFPEGVPGNTKPFWQAYRMKPWSRGFVRVAAAMGAPIVPVAVIGGEECLPVAWTLRRLEPLIGAAIGVPLAPIPLPARWKIVFHPPVEVEIGRAALTDPEYGSQLSERVRSTVQETLEREAGGHALARLSSAVAVARRLARRSAAEITPERCPRGPAVVAPGTERPSPGGTMVSAMPVRRPPVAARRRRQAAAVAH